MSFINELKLEIMNGHAINFQEALKLVEEPLDNLCVVANELREYFCKNSFDICTIINGKSGKCSENCKFCSQSSHYMTSSKEYTMLDNDRILHDAKYNSNRGVLRFSIVTSGRKLSDDEVNKFCENYQNIKQNCDISLCASHGLLTLEQFKKLRNNGVSRYHNNLETSQRYFPSVCTTHTYADKIKAITNAQEAGLEVCSGGIIGMGETMEDRINMVMEIRNLGVKSVPVNILNPIKGTPFENMSRLTYEEICRTIAVFRFIIPDGAIRLAGGRGLLPDKGKKAFQSGANAAISGDMLTTSGISISEDIKMLSELGYIVQI